VRQLSYLLVNYCPSLAKCLPAPVPAPSARFSEISTLPGASVPLQGWWGGGFRVHCPFPWLWAPMATVNMYRKFPEVWTYFRYASGQT